jgi:hypothetical protein
LDVQTKQRAINVEKGLHTRFADRQARGEWFCFLFSSPAEKRSFNDGCRAVFLMELGPGNWWTRIDIAALDKYEKQRKVELINSVNFKQIKRDAIEAKKRKCAWKELAR